MPGRLAVVPPRFGPNVVGGSEAVSREIAIGLAGRGWNVEVLTTCAIDHYSWANDLPEGSTDEDGVAVRRFANVHHHSPTGLRAQQKIQAGILPSFDEQLSWMSSRFTVPGLFEHLLRHGTDYDAVLFSPYMFWTATVCLPVVAERAVAMPCLHDEFYARLDVMRPVLADPARVWFLSEPEHDLAHRLGPLAPAHTVTGAGVDVPARYDPEGFRRRHRLTRPFVLYAGRRELDKGWDWLVEVFLDAIRHGRTDIDLVTIGVGQVEPPDDAMAARVIDLGFLPGSERDDAIAAAVAYLQPSKMESFSRTVMEAWLAATPVLAVEGSEVVAWHCRRSGGGATFTDGPTLARCLDQLLGDPGAAAEMADKGRRYVLDNYTWPLVLDRMEADLEGMP